MYEGEEENVRYFSAFADLNGDGRDEAIVYTIGPKVCGSGGCETHVFTPGKDGYQYVSSTILTRPPVLLPAFSNEGWRDLIVVVRGGGVLEPYNASLTFNGIAYPESASDGRKVDDPAPGDVLIPRASFDEGKPIPKRSGPADPCGPTLELAWRKLLVRMPPDPAEQAQKMEAFRAGCGLPLNFWAGPKAEESHGVGHPCSGVTHAFARTVPAPEDPIHRPEVVYELDSSGKVIDRWWIPVDSVVGAIEGDDLLISLEIGTLTQLSTVFLAVGHNGAFKAAPPRQFPEESRKLIECPKLPDLPASDSRWCWEMTDQRNGKARRIAYDGPCT